MDPVILTIFSGEGASRAAARAVDWHETPLGAPHTWPQSLRTTLGIIMNSRHPMFLWWGPELVQFYNDAYLPSFGRGKHPAAMGQRGIECWQEIWPIIYPQIEDVMLRGKASWNENQLVPIYRNGQLEEVYWTYGYSPVYDDNGNVGGVLVVCTETTSGVLAMRRLDSIRHLATALNDADDSKDVVRIAGACLSKAVFDIPYAVLRSEETEPLSVGLDGAAPPELRITSPVALPAVMRLRTPRSCKPWPEPVQSAIVYPFDGVPGGSLTLGLSPRLPFDEGYRNFLDQIVEQIAIAQGRVAIEVERRRLLLQAPVPTALLVGPEHIYEIANPRYVEMVGRDVLGLRYVDAFPELRGTELPRILDQVYRDGEPFVAQEMLVPLVAASGEREDHYFNFCLEPIRDVRGNVYGMMAVALEITGQVTARTLLEKSNVERAQLLEAANAASRAKDEFLAMLGHELRNPLAPILTALEVMKVKNVAGIDREREIIRRQASHLVHLVDDLLDVSRVVEGKIELKLRRVALSEVIAAAVETASPLLEKRRHALRLEVPTSGLHVYADPMRLAQVVANLLTNAARYTNPEGTITVSARVDGAEVVLRVEDTGIGLRADQLPHLFERFFQGARTGDSVHEGLGLGLALVKGLTELHGGSVHAESAGPGLGSAFEVRLPAIAVEPASSSSQAKLASEVSHAPPVRVLLVDDSEDITDLVGMYLELNGCDVRAAYDGPSALRAVESHSPSVVILDLGLPVMDGYEVAAQLRERWGASAPRLIAMSGYGRRDDLEKTALAGFEAHLVKPVDSATLLRIIKR